MKICLNILIRSLYENILLDILYEEDNYKNIIEKEIDNDLLLTEGKTIKLKYK